MSPHSQGPEPKLPKFGSVQVTKRHHTLSVPEGRALIGAHQPFGLPVETDNLRLRLFKNKPIKCVGCGVEADRAHIESVKSKRYTGHALNFYAGNMLMTKDHIKPLVKKGPDTLENLQPMCWKCNYEKGEKDVTEWVSPLAEAVAAFRAVEGLTGGA